MKHLTDALFIVFIVSLSFGCSEEDWQNLNLNNNECENAGAYIGQFDDGVGTIKSDGSGTKYIELPEGVFGPFQQNLLPCNLEIESLPVNGKIKVSGAIRQNANLPNDDNEINFRFIELSKAQIK